MPALVTLLVAAGRAIARERAADVLDAVLHAAGLAASDGGDLLHVASERLLLGASAARLWGYPERCEQETREAMGDAPAPAPEARAEAIEPLHYTRDYEATLCGRSIDWSAACPYTGSDPVWRETPAADRCPACVAAFAGGAS